MHVVVSCKFANATSHSCMTLTLASFSPCFMVLTLKCFTILVQVVQQLMASEPLALESNTATIECPTLIICCHMLPTIIIFCYN